MSPDRSVVAFGPRLRLLREEAGLSQRALAERAGVGPSTVRYVEGGHGPTLVVAEKLAAGLGLRLGQVMGGAGLDGMETRDA